MSAQCKAAGCSNEATLAIRTTAPAGVRTQIYWDVDDASAKAEPHCEKHGKQLLVGLAESLGRQT